MSRGTAIHSHVFLGAGHAEAERRTWAVIVLCTAMMIAEIVGGSLFGSIALVADGLHMSTHAGALLLAALAYRYARTHAEDRRFAFGTGKFGDLAGYTSAIVLALIAALIGFEAVRRFIAPVPIHFREAIPIAALGLVVNVASAWLLVGGGHDHHHGHGHHHGHDHHHGHADADAPRLIATGTGTIRLDVWEDGVPPVFRLRGAALDPAGVTVETERPDGTRQSFAFVAAPGDPACLISRETIPEPHEFTAVLRLPGGIEARHRFLEHDHAAHRDNNMRAAVVHVLADAAVSLMVIGGLGAAAAFGWRWMDPLAGLVGAGAILSWAYTLLRDTGAILLDMTADARLEAAIRAVVADEGDELADLHLWRLGPGHLGAILAVQTAGPRDAGHYHARLAGFASLSHVTVEVRPGG
ncbi:MAG: CDF family Co(II)/Ni(II) efflux transporter DmeF [Rhodospirillales bacterium]|nr:CDF family Co(II)/Ni(II) efflux transporter DmeF [Rhodospirillales bacterium]